MLAAVALSAVSLGAALWPGAVDERLATQKERQASLSRGTAWIWPDSLGPSSKAGETAERPYQEAAVLVESLVLRGQGVERGGRRAPLSLPPGAKLLPVIHVESAADAPDVFTPRQLEALMAAVRRQAPLAAQGAGMLQLDFEAPARQRRAYQQWVQAVRESLPPDVKLSVTALAHWCTQGNWLDQLPVDEVVPMLYRLGPHAEQWRRRFAHGSDQLARRCRGQALGFATHEPPPARLLARTARPYGFDEARWGQPLPPSRLIEWSHP